MRIVPAWLYEGEYRKGFHLINRTCKAQFTVITTAINSNLVLDKGFVHPLRIYNARHIMRKIPIDLQVFMMNFGGNWSIMSHRTIVLYLIQEGCLSTLREPTQDTDQVEELLPLQIRQIRLSAPCLSQKLKWEKWWNVQIKINRKKMMWSSVQRLESLLQKHLARIRRCINSSVISQGFCSVGHTIQTRDLIYYTYSMNQGIVKLISSQANNQPKNLWIIKFDKWETHNFLLKNQRITNRPSTVFTLRL